MLLSPRARRRSWLLLGVGAVLLGLQAGRPGAVGPAGVLSGDVRPPHPLETARRAAARLRGVEPAGRAQVRRAAALEFLRAAADPRVPTTTAGEAAFRAGELRRASGDLEPARCAFLLCRELAPGTSFAHRAAHALARLAVREGRLELALAWYDSVVTDPAVAPAPAQRWGLEQAELMLARGEIERAKRAFLRLTRDHVDALVRVGAFDGAIRCWITQSDLEAAAGVLKRAREALSAATSTATELGPAVSRALLAMPSIEHLAHAVQMRELRDLRMREDEPVRSGTHDSPPQKR